MVRTKNPKWYHWDASKGKWIAQVKNVRLGSFESHEEAALAVQKHLINEGNMMQHATAGPSVPQEISPGIVERRDHMARKKAATKKSTGEAAVYIYKLRDAIYFISTLINPPSTKKIVTGNLTNLVAYAKGEPNYMTLTQEELKEKYIEEDLVPIFTNYDGVVEIIEGSDGIRSKRDGGEIAIDTKKQYYVAINYLFTRAPGHMKVDADLVKKYKEKIKEWHGYSNDQRRQNKPKRGNAEHPDFTWEIIQRGYDGFLDARAFTNTEKGRRDLKAAALVGLYVIQRPRRVEDWFLLEYHSKLPSENDRKGKNILHIEGETATIYLDKFKTRWRTVNNKTKEVLKTYVKTLNPRMSSVLRDYIQKCGIKDNSRRTAAEKRLGTTFYVFPKVEDVSLPYAKANSLGDYLSEALKKIFGKAGLSANTIRHSFNTYLAEHISEFTDSQLIEIAEDLGDTMRDLPTNLRYRVAKDNADMSKTEIFGALNDDDYAQGVMLANAEDVGENQSVGNDTSPAQQDDDDDEVQSPPMPPARIGRPTAEIADAGIATLLHKMAELESQRTQIYVELLGRLLTSVAKLSGRTASDP